MNWLVNIPKDKWMHYGVSACLTAILKLMLPVLVAVLIVFAIGVAKELYDAISGKGSAEWSDLLADIIGIAIGAT